MEEPVIISLINSQDLTIDTIYDFVSTNKISCDKFKKHDILHFIQIYLVNLGLNVYKYKNQHLTKHLFEIYSIFNYNNDIIEPPKICSIYYDFIKLVTSSINCQNILKKCNLSIFNSHAMEQLLLNTSERGSCISFLFLHDYIKINHNDLLTNEFKNTIFYNSLGNSDDRLYKMLLDANIKNPFINISSPLDYISIISNIFRIHISPKYILRRLKHISTIVNLDEYFSDMITHSKIHNYPISLIDKIVKYYYTNQELSDEILVILAESTYNLNHNESDNSYINKEKAVLSIYNKLNTNYDRNTFIIYLVHIHYTSYNLKMNIKNKKDIPSVDKLGLLMHKEFFASVDYNVIIDIMKMYQPVDIMKTIGKSLNWGNDGMITYIFPYIKYFNPVHFEDQQFIIKLNKCLLYLRLYIRKIRRRSNLSKKIFNLALLNEMTQLKPSNKPIFRDGTQFFKNKKQQFNTLPPYHIYPGQLNQLKNFYIKEKSDGILTYELPRDIYPPVNFINKIKAEYIESLDLYLVYDIDINMQIEDRYSYLRNLHSSTSKYKSKTITNVESMIDLINIERTILKDFLSQPYDTYRWYPKAAWKVISENLIEELNNIINDKSIYIKWLCSEGPIQNDGFIITPLNGDREIKIKPKHLMTIDLLYKNNTWLDRENNIYHNIKCSDVQLSDNTIWRCYPVENSTKHEPREIRFDKIKPNKKQVIDNILCLSKIEYKNVYPSIYHTKIEQHYSELYLEWNKIITINNNCMKKMVKLLPCKNILDLGCGNGKILKYISDFKSYMGIDMDVNMLAKGAFNTNTNIHFNNMDLSIDWKANKWNELDSNYDTVIAVNSLQHFCSDIFWEQLNQVTTKNSKMLFNLVHMDKIRYEFDDSYMERIDNLVKYKFTPIHINEMTEPYIDNINSIIEKYNWKIISEYVDNTTLLPHYYKWYIIIRI